MNQIIEAHIRISLDPAKVLSVEGDINGLFGCSAEEVLSGKVGLINRFHSNDQDITEVLFSTNTRCLSGSCNLRLRQTNKSICCVKGYYNKVLDDKNNSVTLELTLQDVKSLHREIASPHISTDFTAMMENTDDYIYFKDRNHVFTGASETLVSLTEPSNHWTDLLGQTDYDVFPEKYADIYYELEKQVFSGIQVAHEEQEILDVDGNKGWVDNRKYPIHDDSGEIIGLFGIARDITAKKEAEYNLRIAAAAFEAQEGILITDANTVTLNVNNAFTRISGYTAEDIIGKKPSLLQSGQHDAVFYRGIWDVINQTGHWEGEVTNKHKKGHSYSERLTITAVVDNKGTITNYVSTHTDITERKAAEKQIASLAFYDPLTKLPNRRLLMDRLHHAIVVTKRKGKYGAVFFLDLDNFKELNDSLGHDIGDLLLEQISERLSNIVREDDTVGRLGGDEFVIILENLDKNYTEALEQAKVVANNILVSINRPYQLDTHEYLGSTSIGVTLFCDDQTGEADLIKQADSAMYRAKRDRRNPLKFFEDNSVSTDYYDQI